ncbi:MAG: diguanylate cyclase [gamma proteobacterium symbiont of Taylorina sp.]|nr:diguanylate cyclase [gamma proteobacterium symbiont of Taylorina sp.]
MINLLLIDDSEDELFLLEDELVQGGLSLEIQRVDNEQDMKSALASAIKWDIALVDYVMPDFTAERALEILKETKKDIPVIVVSGQASEEIAVLVMRLGARDYISKYSRFRLIPSIQREMESCKRRKKQHKFKKQLRQTEQKLAAVAEVAHDAIIIVKDNYIIEFWNHSAERIFAYKKQEVLGKNILDIIVPAHFTHIFRMVSEKLFSTGKITSRYKAFETKALKKGKIEFPVEVSLSSVKINNKWLAIGILRDISERHELEKKLRQLATHDTLTGLFNRREIILRLKQEMIRFNRYHSPITIFFIDIDHFKNINDKYGHQTGDETLIDCAHRMRSLMRKNDIVGRYGGEEFLIILPETPINKSLELAERLRKNIAESSTIKESSTTKESSTKHKKDIPDYTISIGIAELNDDQMTLDSLINHADKAMYQAKQTGRNKICIDSMGKKHD